MSEDFLQFIWKQQAYTNTCKTESGKKFEILDPGEHNHDAGPDFFNARIKMDGAIWAGNVEIHTKTSEWNNHKHQNDPAYNNVILHVVAEHDKEIVTQDKRQPETWVMKYPEEYSHAWIELLQSLRWIPCEHLIHKVKPLEILMWMQDLAVQRLQFKTTEIKQELDSVKSDFDTTFFRTITRYFGFNTNQIPFDMLGHSVKWQTIAKHRDNIQQIEALLFGQAGFLIGDLKDDYYRELKREYNLLQRKFNLKPIDAHLWKFSRMRPGNFPSIRIAQLAMILHQNDRLFSKVIDCENITDIENIFNISTSEYWETHYRFGEVSEFKEKKLGSMAKDSLLINAIIPCLFLYGQEKGQDEFQDRAINFLESIKVENNRVIRHWANLGIVAENALESQSLIHLKKHYCNPKKCLTCRIGQQLIRQYNETD